MRPGWAPGNGRRPGVLFSDGGDGFFPGGLVAGFAGAVDFGEADGAGFVDEEGAAVGEAGFFVEDTVSLRDGAVRPEVRQKGELVALVLGPGFQGEYRVDGDAKHLDVGVGVVGELVAELAQLGGADAAESEGVEHKQ